MDKNVNSYKKGFYSCLVTNSIYGNNCIHRKLHTSICTCKWLTLMVFQRHRYWWLVVLNWLQTPRVISILVNHDGIYYIFPRSSITMEKWLVGNIKYNLSAERKERHEKRIAFFIASSPSIFRLIFSRRSSVVCAYRWWSFANLSITTLQTVLTLYDISTRFLCASGRFN